MRGSRRVFQLCPATERTRGWKFQALLYCMSPYHVGEFGSNFHVLVSLDRILAIFSLAALRSLPPAASLVSLHAGKEQGGPFPTACPKTCGICKDGWSSQSPLFICANDDATANGLIDGESRCFFRFRRSAVRSP